MIPYPEKTSNGLTDKSTIKDRINNSALQMLVKNQTLLRALLENLIEDLLIYSSKDLPHKTFIQRLFFFFDCTNIIHVVTHAKVSTLLIIYLSFQNNAFRIGIKQTIHF